MNELRSNLEAQNRARVAQMKEFRSELEARSEDLLKFDKMATSIENRALAGNEARRELD